MAAANGIAKSTSGVEFFGSQVGGKAVTPIAYTSSPMKLLFADFRWALRHAFDLPSVVFPWMPYGSDYLDELYPSLANLWDIFLHVIIFICQAFFLLSIPFWLLFPVWAVACFVIVFLLSNSIFCTLLNGPLRCYDSNPDITARMPKHENEQWVFINGVAVGRHWLRSNVDRLALTFGRPVRGVHNKTDGILFDLIECLVQRNFDYAAENVRDCYKIVKAFLYDPSKTKVVFILHSQGAIEGGMILDWLLLEVPQDLLAKLEVYTFGNAANHFNNPHLRLHSQKEDTSAALSHWIPTSKITAVSYDSDKAIDRQGLVSKISEKTIRYIEHYANGQDPVAKLGVLQSTSVIASPSSISVPSFMGRVFTRPGRGHQFNQHYLDNMFPLNKEGTRVLDTNEFMDGEVQGRFGADQDSEIEGAISGGWEEGDEYFRNVRENLAQSVQIADPKGTGGKGEARVEVEVWDAGSPTVAKRTGSWLVSGEGESGGGEAQALRVSHLSRLWLYRNGGSPSEDL